MPGEQHLMTNAAVSETAAEPHAAAQRPRRDWSVLIAAISNLGIQYNFQSIAIALVLMDDSTGAGAASPPAPPGALPPSAPPPYVAPYPRDPGEESLLKSLVFAGAILGQLSMGYAGDAWGRRNAMVLTNAFTFVGAAGSALVTWGEPSTLYAVLMVCRFLIGVGVGGKYPLAATMRSEACQEDGAPSHSATEVAKGFFWQTPGAMAPYVVALIVLATLGHSQADLTDVSTVSLQFRIILGVGAIPAFIVMVLCCFQDDSEAYAEARAGGRTESLLAIAARHPEHWRRLVGTGVGWLLYDFVFYGTALSQPAILDAVFGKSETMYQNCLQNILVTAMGLPGTICAIAMLQRMGSKRLQSWGFIAIAGASAAFAVTMQAAPDSTAASFALTLLLMFVLNWGVNVSSYVLPTEVFPTAVRSSFFGLSAGLGKVGALLGGATFAPLSEQKNGFTLVFLICAAVSLAGLLITHAFVEPYGKRTLCCDRRASTHATPMLADVN